MEFSATQATACPKRAGVLVQSLRPVHMSLWQLSLATTEVFEHHHSNDVADKPEGLMPSPSIANCGTTLCNVELAY